MARRYVTPIVLPADPTSALEAATKQYVDALRTQLFGGATRTQAPVCALYSNENRELPATTDVFQDAQWAISGDTDSIWHPGLVGSGAGYMEVPVAGRYLIMFRALVGGIAGIHYGAKILLNGTSVADHSIASDIVFGNVGASEPYYLQAEARDRVFAAGDLIRFGLWRGSGGGTATCYGSWFTGIRTHAVLQWIGPT